MNTFPCPHCQSPHIIRFGRLRGGQQRYRCRACNKTFCPEAKARQTDPLRKQQIMAAYQQRCSMRGVARIFGVSRNTLSGWIKKNTDPASTGNDPGSGAGP